LKIGLQGLKYDGAPDFPPIQDLPPSLNTRTYRQILETIVIYPVQSNPMCSDRQKKKKIYSPKRLVARKGFSPSTLATVNTNITC